MAVYPAVVLTNERGTMTTATNRTAETVSALIDSGECWNDDMTYGYRLRNESDDINPMDCINGCDTYGKVAWVQRRRDRFRGCFTGAQDHATRPAGFTGAAEKMTTLHGDPYWWEPYREGCKVYKTDNDRQMVADIMNYGTRVAILETLEAITDSYGNRHVVVSSTRSVGGLEPFIYGSDLESIVEEMLYETLEELVYKETK
jgi:hypothetical protein